MRVTLVTGVPTFIGLLATPHAGSNGRREGRYFRADFVWSRSVSSPRPYPLRPGLSQKRRAHQGNNRGEKNKGKPEEKSKESCPPCLIQPPASSSAPCSGRLPSAGFGTRGFKEVQNRPATPIVRGEVPELEPFLIRLGFPSYKWQ